MATRKSIGVYPQPDGGCVIVSPSRETVSKTRELRLSQDQTEIFVEHVLATHPQASGPRPKPGSRKEALFDVLEEHKGISLGYAVNLVLENLGLDSEDKDERGRVVGIINTSSEAGEVVRDVKYKEGRKIERLWLAKDYKEES